MNDQVTEDSAPQPPMDLEQALETIRLVKKVYAEHDVKFTLAAGTLLGAAREGKFMGWDYDIDLSCSDDADAHKIPEICASLNALGISTYYSEAFRVIGVYHRGVTVDIDFWRRDGQDLTMPLRFALNPLGKFLYFFEWLVLHKPTASLRMDIANRIKFARTRWLAGKMFSALPFAARAALAKGIRSLARATGNPRGMVHVPAKYFDGYSKVSFCGEEYLAPADIDGYLTNRYGVDWRIPQKGWIYYNKNGEIFSKSQVPTGDWSFKQFPVPRKI